MLPIGKEDEKYFNWLVHLGYICKLIVTIQGYVGSLHNFVQSMIPSLIVHMASKMGPHFVCVDLQVD